MSHMTTDPDELRLRALEEKKRSIHAEQAAESRTRMEEDQRRKWANARAEKQAADLDAIDAECMEIIARQDKRKGLEDSEAQRMIMQRRAEALTTELNQKQRELGIGKAELRATLDSLARQDHP